MVNSLPGTDYVLPAKQFQIFKLSANGYETFMLLNAQWVTGCGMGILCKFYGCTSFIVKDEKVVKEAREKLIVTIKTEASKNNNWYKIMCTLGDSYDQKPLGDFIRGLGFKEIDWFYNKTHGANYKQHIYTVNIEDLK